MLQQDDKATSVVCVAIISMSMLVRLLERDAELETGSGMQTGYITPRRETAYLRDTSPREAGGRRNKEGKGNL